MPLRCKASTEYLRRQLILNESYSIRATDYRDIKQKMISVYSINITKTFYCVKRVTITNFGSDIVRKYANNIIFCLIISKHMQKLLTVITIYRNNPR
jgi:hypothetical protein